MNKVILIGRLTKEHTIRNTESGSIVVSNSVALRRDENTADFVDIVAFGKTADLLSQYFTKGDRIGLEGSIRTTRYQNAQGENRYQTAVIVEKLEFLQEKREQPTQPAYNDYPYAPRQQAPQYQPAQQYQQAPKQQQYQQQAPKQTNPFADVPYQYEINDDDLPF